MHCIVVFVESLNSTMNHRRALKASTDTGLGIFLIMIVGVVLWTTDEMLGWNILPDWIDKFAQLLVILFAMLAGFAVVISIMCSFAVIAESAAKKEGIMEAPKSRRIRIIIPVGVALMFGTMFTLHKVDQFRAHQRAEDRSQRIQERMPKNLSLFTPERMQMLSPAPTAQGDEEIARLLNALELSNPFNPQAGVIIPAATPYAYCIITALDRPRREQPTDDWIYLDRRYLTDFPSDWERAAIQAGFNGEEIKISDQNQGVFFNTHFPTGIGVLKGADRVVGILALKGSR